MASLSIELDPDRGRRLRELAAAMRKTEGDVCREAVERFLDSQVLMGPVPARDRRAALRKMIALVPAGPVDASVVHDVRPGDEP